MEKGQILAQRVAPITAPNLYTLVKRKNKSIAQATEQCVWIRSLQDRITDAILSSWNSSPCEFGFRCAHTTKSRELH